MSRKEITTVEIRDDLTGELLEKASETTFTFKGKSYTLDLGPQSLKSLEEALAPFIKAAPKVESLKRAAVSPAAVRTWAEKQGLLEPGSKGRISKEVMDAYNAKHGSL